MRVRKSALFQLSRYHCLWDYSTMPKGRRLKPVMPPRAALAVKDIIVCGHTYCGAMKAVLDPDSLDRRHRLASHAASTAIAKIAQ